MDACVRDHLRAFARSKCMMRAHTHAHVYTQTCSFTVAAASDDDDDDDEQLMPPVMLQPVMMMMMMMSSCCSQ